MSRVAWCRLLLLVLALPLASCFKANDACQTCPQDNSGRIDVAVPKDGAVDSVHALMDGGASISVKRSQRGSFLDLAPGTYTVQITRYFSSFGIVSTKYSVVEVQLIQGETRVIVFHNDFPLVTEAVSPDPAKPAPPDRVPPSLAFLTPHPGWAIA